MSSGFSDGVISFSVDVVCVSVSSVHRVTRITTVIPARTKSITTRMATKLIERYTELWKLHLFPKLQIFVSQIFFFTHQKHSSSCPLTTTRQSCFIVASRSLYTLIKNKTLLLTLIPIVQFYHSSRNSVNWMYRSISYMSQVPIQVLNFRILLPYHRY